jgi:hypothetical protein
MIRTGSAGSHGAERWQRLFLFAGILVLLSSFSTQAAEPATITFSLSFPDSDPERYTITVQSDGHARYECSAKISNDSDERENYQTEFSFSEATRARIFELAAQAIIFRQS